MSSEQRDRHLGIAPCTELPFAPGEHPGLVPTEAWQSSASYHPLVMEDRTAINKPMKKQAPAAALSQGLRRQLGCESGDLAGVSLAGSRQGERGLQAAASS